MNVKNLQNIAGYPQGKKELIKQFQNTNDIVEAVMQQHELNRNAFDKIAKSFDTGNDYDTCKKIWEFTHYKLNYKAEPDLQTVKSLSKILYDGQNDKGNDCKHFSCFEAGILESLQIPFFYRFAAYNGKIPTHVYVVANIGKNKIVLDGVLPYFDSEKSYTYKIDINPLKKKKNMPLYRLSGVSTIGRVSKLVHLAAVVPFNTSRIAFLMLVKFNVFGLGTKVNSAIIKNRTKVEDFWRNFGGLDFDKLLNNSIEGKTKNKILGLDQNSINFSPDYSRIGVAGEFAAFVASATPIIIAMTALLKELNVSVADIVNQVNPTPDPGIPDPGTPDPTKMSNSTLLMIGAAAVIAFVIFKKK